MRSKLRTYSLLKTALGLTQTQIENIEYMADSTNELNEPSGYHFRSSLNSSQMDDFESKSGGATSTAE